MSHATETAAHGGKHGSLKSYLTGFALSIALTALSFGCVMSGLVPAHLIAPGLMVFCIAQVLVQLGFFLHMGLAPEQRENLMVAACALIFIAIVVVGSLWVMHNANALMMPGMAQG